MVIEANRRAEIADRDETALVDRQRRKPAEAAIARLGPPRTRQPQRPPYR